MKKRESNREMTDQKLQETWNTEDIMDQKQQETWNTEDAMDQKLQETWNAEDTVDQVLLDRIERISSQNHLEDKPDLFNKRDYIQAVVIMVVCLCAVVAGAFLTT